MRYVSIACLVGLILISSVSCAVGNHADPQSFAKEVASKAEESKESENETDIYRGIVVISDNSDGTRVVKLKRASGTVYEPDEIEVKLSEKTQSNEDNKDIEIIKEGDYVEVSLEKTSETPVEVITYTLLEDPELTIVNGEVVEIKKDEEGKVVGLLLNSIDTNTEIYFHIDAKTVINIENKFQVGDKLNIYHSGNITKSIPPQGTALEINEYTL